MYARVHNFTWIATRPSYWRLDCLRQYVMFMCTYKPHPLFLHTYHDNYYCWATICYSSTAWVAVIYLKVNENGPAEVVQYYLPFQWYAMALSWVLVGTCGGLIKTIPSSWQRQLWAVSQDLALFHTFVLQSQSKSNAVKSTPSSSVVYSPLRHLLDCFKLLVQHCLFTLLLLRGVCWVSRQTLLLWGSQPVCLEQLVDVLTLSLRVVSVLQKWAAVWRVS